jgi:hypothetical protein
MFHERRAQQPRLWGGAGPDQSPHRGPNSPLQTPELFKPLDQPSRYKAAYGGRGSGKQHPKLRANAKQLASIPRRRMSGGAWG